MASRFPDPITKDTFPQACEWADRRLRRAKKRRAFIKLAPAITQPVFAVVLAAMVYGMIYDYGTAMTTAYLDKLPQAVQLWERLRPLVYSSAETLPQQLLAWCVPLYLLPMALALAVALLVLVVYHPRRNLPNPQDSAAEQARQLCLTLRGANAMSKIPPSNLVGFWNALFAVVGAAVLFGFVLFALMDSTIEAAVESHAHLANWGLFAAFLVVLLGYQLICLPLTLFQRLLAWCHVPKKALDAAERWFKACQTPPTQEAPQAPADQPAQTPPAQEPPQTPADQPAQTPPAEAKP